MSDFRIPITQHDAKNFRTTKTVDVKLSNGRMLTIEEGFITDLASVPRYLRGILPSYGRYTDAAIIHDYLYRTYVPFSSRKFADDEFLHFMKLDKVKKWKRNVMYAFVRLFGRWSYKDFTGI